MSKYLESCNNECKIVMLLLIIILGFLLYKCYNKPSACAREEFAVKKKKMCSAYQRSIGFDCNA